MTQRTQRTQNMTAAERKTARQQKAAEGKLTQSVNTVMPHVKHTETAAQPQTDWEEMTTFYGYADRLAETAETVRNTHTLLSINAIRNCSALANSYRQTQHTAWTEYTETARRAANIISASVVRKCDNVSCSEMTHLLRISRAADVQRMETATEMIDREIAISTDKNGNEEEEYTEDYSRTAAHVFETILDGADLYQTAYENILKYGSEGIDSEFSERVLDKRVVIRTEESAAWKDSTTTAGQKAHRAVRAAIENSRAAVDNNKYCYLSELLTDESGTEAEAAEAVLYYRLPKYFYETSTAQSDSYNIHSLPVTVTEAEAAEAAERQQKAAEVLTAQFKLSAQQKEVLSETFKGYGTVAIATKLGVKKGNVINQKNRIKEKVSSSDWYKQHTAEQAQAEAIMYWIQTEAEEQKTAAQKAAEAENTAQKAEQQAEAAQSNAIRAAQKAAEAEKAEMIEEAIRAAQKAAEAAKQARRAAEAARTARRAARRAAEAACAEKAAQIQARRAAEAQKAARRAAEQAEAAERAAQIRKAAQKAAEQAEQRQRAAEAAQKAAEAEQAQKEAQRTAAEAQKAVQKAQQSGRAFYRHIAVIKITAARRAARRAAELNK